MLEKTIVEDRGVVKGNIVGVLCYLGGILSAVLLLVLEKDNKFVRFHAMQSAITFVVLVIAATILSAIASFFWILFAFIPLVWILGLIIFIFLMYKAYQGEEYKLPMVGEIAKKQIYQ